jgi:hypothetical protein
MGGPGCTILDLPPGRKHTLCQPPASDACAVHGQLVAQLVESTSQKGAYIGEGEKSGHGIVEQQACFLAAIAHNPFGVDHLPLVAGPQDILMVQVAM